MAKTQWLVHFVSLCYVMDNKKPGAGSSNVIVKSNGDDNAINNSEVYHAKMLFKTLKYKIAIFHISICSDSYDYSIIDHELQ